MHRAPDRQGSLESGKPSKEVLEALIADWLLLYAANFGKEPTEETAVNFKTGFSDLDPKYLHKAFVSCLKKYKFWPTVAGVREAYETVREANARRYYLPEAAPVWTDDERKEFVAELNEVMGWKDRSAPMTEAETKARLEVLKKQAESLREQEQKKAAPE